MNVRDDVFFGDMTIDEQTVVRMWLAMRLNVQWSHPNYRALWVDIVYDEPVGPYDNRRYRLAP